MRGFVLGIKRRTHTVSNQSCYFLTDHYFNVIKMIIGNTHSKIKYEYNIQNQVKSNSVGQFIINVEIRLKLIQWQKRFIEDITK